MDCPFCGKADNPAAARFCSHCGTMLLGRALPDADAAGASGNFDERFGGAAHPPPPPVVPPPVVPPPVPAPEPIPMVTPEMVFSSGSPDPVLVTGPTPEPMAARSAPVDDGPLADAAARDGAGAAAGALLPGLSGPLSLPGTAGGPDDAGTQAEVGEPAAPGEPIGGAGSGGSGDATGAGTARPASGADVVPPIAAAADAGPWFERHGASGRTGEPRSKESRYWAAGAHASAFVGAWMGGVPAFIGPLIVWLARKDDDPFAAEHGRNALNFNLSVIVYVLAMAIFSIFTFGIGLLVTIPGFILLGLSWFALTLVGTIKAASSETYRYPLTIRFVR